MAMVCNSKMFETGNTCSTSHAGRIQIAVSLAVKRQQVDGQWGQWALRAAPAALLPARNKP